jgi:hypothetical protein
VDIDLARPRTLALREDDAFTALERRVRHELQTAMAERGEFSAEISS